MLGVQLKIGMHPDVMEALQAIIRTTMALVVTRDMTQLH